MFSFSATPKRKASPRPAASHLLAFSATADAGVCAPCGKRASTVVWPLPPGEAWLGVSADQVCCFWQQNQLKGFELQPCSHSPKDLNEGKVMTLRMGIISREVWGSLLRGLRSLVAAVSWSNVGRTGSCSFLVLSWSETCPLGPYRHCSASISSSGEWKSLYLS